MQAKERTQFIESLELADIGSVALLENAPAGYVVGGSAESFVAGVSHQSQRDALNSTLLAQLAANQKYDREKDTTNWYSFYRNVLENVGWVIQNFSFTKYNSQNASFTMDKVVLEILAAVASGDEIAVVQATNDALKKLKQNDGRLVLFETSSHSASSGNFQICVANEAGGILTMKIGAFYFSTTQQVTNVLWFSFGSSSTSMYKGAQTISLNKQIYATVRAQIVAKLGEKANRFVRELDIG